MYILFIWLFNILDDYNDVRSESGSEIDVFKYVLGEYCLVIGVCFLEVIV